MLIPLGLLLGVMVLWGIVRMRSALIQAASNQDRIQVFDDNDIRYLCFNGAKAFPQSCLRLSAPHQLVSSYSKLLMAALFISPTPSTLLVIGLGGGILPMTFRRLLPMAHITIVELDPDIAQAAMDHFNFLEDSLMHVTLMDGRAFVQTAQQNHREYDLIILDAFDEVYIPKHMMSTEFLTEVKAITATGGIVASNTFVRSAFYDQETENHHSVFGDVYTLRSDTNRIIFAGAGELPDFENLAANAILLEDEFLSLGINAQEMAGMIRMKNGEILDPARGQLL